MKIADLTPFGRKVWDAFPCGRDVEFSGVDGEKTEQGQSWGAEVIRRLLVSGRPADGEIASLRLTGVRVIGRLEQPSASLPNGATNANEMARRGVRECRCPMLLESMDEHRKS